VQSRTKCALDVNRQTLKVSSQNSPLPENRSAAGAFLAKYSHSLPVYPSLKNAKFSRF
jgi:hypothetical protein